MALPPVNGGHNRAFDAYILSAVSPQVSSHFSLAPSPQAPSRSSLSSQSTMGNMFMGRQWACERCRRHKTRCDNGRPCKRCAGKAAGQACLDCDTVSQSEVSVREETTCHGVVDVVGRSPGFQSRTILVPEEINRVLAKTKSEILASQFGHSIWFRNKSTSKKNDRRYD